MCVGFTMNKLSDVSSAGHELWTHPSLSDVSEPPSLVSAGGRGYDALVTDSDDCPSSYTTSESAPSCVSILAIRVTCSFRSPRLIKRRCPWKKMQSGMENSCTGGQEFTCSFSLEFSSISCILCLTTQVKLSEGWKQNYISDWIWCKIFQLHLLVEC